MQCALRRIIVDALHAVLLETVDVDQQLGNVIRALTIEARHHVRNVRQLFWIKSANPHLILDLKSLGGVNIEIRANLFRCRGGLNGLDTMRRQQLLDTTRRERVNDNNALIVPVAQGHQAFNNGVGQRVALNDQGAVVAVLHMLRLVEPLLKSLRKPAERWSQGWARALKQCGEIEPHHVGAAVMVAAA